MVKNKTSFKERVVQLYQKKHDEAAYQHESESFICHECGKPKSEPKIECSQLHGNRVQAGF